jgi:hypothetical protein
LISLPWNRSAASAAATSEKSDITLKQQQRSNQQTVRR